ncbi:MAG: peptidyl-prolyl cis-trans isomerase [Octadecabacter sp.]|nr:peptidyl-prolyl cis-trans isomerase [Octadecabacter sp.]
MAKGKTRNFFVWIILGLLFVGLLGFGATGLSGTVRTVGTVGEKPITTQAYFNELARQIQLRGLELQLDRPLSFPEAEAQGVPLRALQTVIAERAIDNEAAKMGLSVGDDIIGEQVLAQPGFRGPSGEFDREAYRNALSRQGLSVREYETSLRDELSRALLRESVYRGLPMPQVYGETLAQFTREGRTFTWATLTADGAGIVLPEPSEADLLAHYEANPADFTSPEIRVVTYAWLTPEMIQDSVTVDEAELRAEYDARIAEYVQPERRLVERLAFSNAEAAQAAADAIAAGETNFPDLVAERGLTLEDVDIGDVTEPQLGAAGSAVFALQPGDVAGPFDTDLGPALFRMNAILAAREITFEEATPELREDQAALRARRVIETQIDPINDLVAGGAALEDLAEQTDMQLGTLEWSDAVSDDIAAYAAFRDVVTTLNVGDFPELLELDDGGLFAVRMDEIRAPALIPFEDVRDDVIAGWEAAEASRLVLAEATVKQGQLNEAVTDFAALGLDAIQDSDIVRTAFINGTPPTFLSRVFEMEPGAVEVIPYNGAAIIVRLDAIAAPDPEDTAFIAERDALNETAQNGMAQDVFQIFTNTVQINTDVSVNDAAINAVHTNFR